jgi:transcriptional regulator with XRE-family HTH domain
MTTVNKNLKHLRLKHSLTQKQFAEKLGLKQSVIGAYEEERATPPLNVLLEVSSMFKVSMDVLTRKDLSKLPEKEWKSLSVSKEVLAITVDASGKENVEFVSQKASAGYLAGYQDPEFIAELPKINFPVLPRTKTYRAFEIQGDSMLPIQPGSILFGEFVEDMNSIRNGSLCVLVTRQEGIVFKRIFRFDNDLAKLLLVSENRKYEPYAMSAYDILEVWAMRAYYSTRFPELDLAPSSLTDQLALKVLQLQEQLTRLRNR